MARRLPRARNERGATAMVALFLALVLAGLAVGLVFESGAARAAVSRQETSLKALEVAEAGICRAEVEIRAELDGGTDGIGTVSGTYGNGAYEVTTSNDPVSPDRYVCTAKGTHGMSARRIEVGLRRRQRSYFVEGLFSKTDLVMNGTVQTDGYDSRLGSYASQATNVDARGPYALPRGDIGSNGGIDLNGSSPTIRGDAIPGLGDVVTMDAIPAPTVYGDTIPREIEIPLDDVPLATFQAAATTNNNGSWGVSGGSVLWNASRCSMRVSTGTTLTLTGGTYFFSDFTLRAGAVLNVTGPSKIYVTGDFDCSAGTMANPTGVSGNLQIYAHPYPLPTTYDPPRTEVKFAGHPQCAAAIYAPAIEVTISGNSDFFGAIVADRITMQGNPFFHYDLALGQIEIKGGATFERLYWRELSPPPR